MPPSSAIAGREPLALRHKLVEHAFDGVVHLTTRQCAADRRKILENVRARLLEGFSCRLIATSLVEAGVDLDFPRVWRAEAGLDQIAQAAGAPFTALTTIDEVYPQRPDRV